VSSTSNQVEVTVLLNNIRDGNVQAQEELFQHVYQELRAAARNLLKRERSDVDMQTTTLVQEAVCRLFKDQVPENAPNRRYLFAAANRAMRQILVDHARRPKLHGPRLPLDDVCRNFETKHGFDLEVLDRALTKLGEANPRQREMIEHRYFGGLTIGQTAELLEVSVQTVERDWRLARAKLYRELKGDEESHRSRVSRVRVKPK
jgi:RNA polymerase sigma factor (TIGR02999 family)